MEVAWVAHHHHAAVVRHVEPPVRVDGPRVRGGVALYEMRAGGGCRRPEPERPVHVHPGARRLRLWNDLVRGIERARVDVARLQADERVVIQRWRSEEHTSELQSQSNLVCRLLLEKKNY